MERQIYIMHAPLVECRRVRSRHVGCPAINPHHQDDDSLYAVTVCSCSCHTPRFKQPRSPGTRRDTAPTSPPEPG